MEAVDCVKGLETLILSFAFIPFWHFLTFLCSTQRGPRFAANALSAGEDRISSRITCCLKLDALFFYSHSGFGKPVASVVFVLDCLNFFSDLCKQDQKAARANPASSMVSLNSTFSFKT